MKQPINLSIISSSSDLGKTLTVFERNLTGFQNLLGLYPLFTVIYGW